jgi:hypothetical protein
MTSPTPTTTERFLEAIAAGAGIPDDLFVADAVLDATVPGWRFEVRGAHAVAAKYSQWFENPAEFEELDRHRFDGGEVVTYLQAFVWNGVPHAVRHCHVLTIRDGRIAHDQFFCGGRWPAGLLAEMATASDAG